MRKVTRLQAASVVRFGFGLNIQNDDGTFVRISFQGDVEEDHDGNVYPSGFYRTPFHINADRETVWGTSEKMASKEVLEVIRARYPRYTDESCNHRYDIWNERGTRVAMRVRCTMTREHFHCASCGAAEPATGLYSHLCGECHEVARKEREEITKRMMEYEMRFACVFKKDVEMVNYYHGDEDSHGGYVSDREDFHADG